MPPHPMPDTQPTRQSPPACPSASAEFRSISSFSISGLASTSASIGVNTAPGPMLFTVIFIDQTAMSSLPKAFIASSIKFWTWSGFEMSAATATLSPTEGSGLLPSLARHIRLSDVIDDHGGPFPCKANGDRLADPGSCTRHNRDFVL